MPFKGDTGNVLYVKIVLGITTFAANLAAAGEFYDYPFWQMYADSTRLDIQSCLSILMDTAARLFTFLDRGACCLHDPPTPTAGKYNKNTGALHVEARTPFEAV